MPERTRSAPISRCASGAPAPLSAAQQRFWFFEQFAPGTHVYNRPAAFTIRGRLDVESIGLAIGDVVARHEVLRTVYAVVDGVPVQRVLDSEWQAFEVIDLQHTPASERESEVRRRVQSVLEQPIDLSSGPIVRAQLYHFDETHSALAFVVHHIAFDGWSEGLFLREMAASYALRSAGRNPTHDPLPIQYADYAAWQQTELLGTVTDRQLDYWRTRLHGVRGILDLPTDLPRPRQRNFRGERRGARLSSETHDGLRQLSRRNGVTLFMSLLAAWSTLLFRYTGDDDLVVGCPIAGRRRVELEGLIGCFINMAPVRVDLSGDPTFESLLRRVRDASLAAFANQDTPLQSLLAEVRPDRDPSRAPLFQVMFNLRNLPEAGFRLPGLEVTRFRVETRSSLVDLSLEAEPLSDGLNIEIEFDADVFEAQTAERALGHLKVLLDHVIADPSRHVSELPIMSDAERDGLLTMGRGNRVSLPRTTVHALVGEQAARTPERDAAVLEDRGLTYSQLDASANRLAHHLRTLGVGRDVPVGVLMERTLDVPVAMLGVLRAGGAWLPLDPDMPPDRLALMLEDARPPVVLTVSSLLDRVPAIAKDAVLCLDSDRTLIDQRPAHDPRVESRPDDAAYVLYTSGSTGRPKGAVVTHGAFLNLVLALIDEYELKPDDRMVHFASISFDGMIEETFVPWVRGATVVLRTDEWIASPARFLHSIDQHRITVLNLPTAFWHEWVRSLAAGSERLPESLRLVVTGGEKAAADAYHSWRAVTGSRIRWLNTYGPTETTVISTAWDPGRRARQAQDLSDIPIGRPIANTHVYVLDTHGRPVPIGIPGELYIGGAGVGRGYLNRPELTAERFVPDPFDDGRVVYRTGDRVRFRADGDLEFVNRVDRQFKLRGYRIEPGEIEVALRSHTSVDDAVVTVSNDGPAGPRLVAFVVARPADALDAAVLRGHLRERLPEYMVPAVFVRLDALPVGPTGKLDRTALPTPDVAHTAAVDDHQPPRTDAERRMARIWEELLGVEQVGITDDFFALGGHSLLALRLGARVEAEFGSQIPMSALFEGATIEYLVKRLDRSASGTSPLVPIQPNGKRRPFFCVHEFFGDVVLYDRLARRLGGDRPFWGLQPPAIDGGTEPARDIRAMAATYIDAMRSVQPEGPYALGGMCAGGLVALEMAHQLRADGHTVALLALLDSAAWSFVPAGERPSRRNGWLDFLRDIPEWLVGLRDLTAHQWRDVLRLKAGLWRQRLTPGRRSREEIVDRAGDDRIHAIGSAFSLSLQQRQIAHAFRQALRDYRPRPYAGRMVLFRARMQPLIGPHDPSKGWSPLAAGEFAIRTVPGNHLGMLQEPHVATLANELETALADAESRSVPGHNETT